MSRPSRYRAFTIMEITIAMMISAIVIVICYTCYLIIKSGYSEFEAKQKTLVELGQLNKVISRDIEKNDLIIKSADGFIIKNPFNDISYSVQAEYVLRSAVSVDTFKVKIDNVMEYFEGRLIENLATDDEGNRIDQISFNAVIDSNKILCYYSKHYSSQQLFNRDKNANN